MYKSTLIQYIHLRSHTCTPPTHSTHTHFSIPMHTSHSLHTPILTFFTAVLGLHCPITHTSPSLPRTTTHTSPSPCTPTVTVLLPPHPHTHSHLSLSLHPYTHSSPPHTLTLTLTFLLPAPPHSQFSFPLHPTHFSLPRTPILTLPSQQPLASIVPRPLPSPSAAAHPPG